ncbi:conjugal transfer protein TraN [Geothermobacter hydrogeniphilus]|uniref:Conjugal transfer mating pair stabilization protein TraN n=1 Tax=Geothermobacter hydrogeniphilus TaxID=1969733 RepID=A0A1X0XXA5_9BACT|nr:conjugal transfer protein TraN [Geothermobacter hydrogeniphilus]ORJ57499.1 hypothetical protein B5V00_13700 [Geothermobacter hydrogeniphilus]
MRRLTAVLVLSCFIAGMPVNALAILTCGADLNGDGFTDTQTETATCATAPVHNGQTSQDFCPVQAVDCVADTAQPRVEQTCSLGGYTYNQGSGRCEKVPDCPGGSWDAASKSCAGGLTTAPTPLPPPTCSARLESAYGGWHSTPCTTAPQGRCQVADWPFLYGPLSRGVYVAQFDSLCNWVSVTSTWYNRDGSVNSTSTYTDYNQNDPTQSFPLAPGEDGTAWSTDPSAPTQTYTNTTQPRYGCPQGYQLQGPVCVQPPVMDCGGGTYDAAAGVCTTSSALAKVCDSGVYDPATGLCRLDRFTCPAGNYACLDTGAAVPQCSPNTCVDVAAPSSEVPLPPPNDTWLQNDGQVAADGSCLGELYIFSGKPSRCRPPGLTVGYLNDCCDSGGEMVSDSRTGPSLSTTVHAISVAYHMAQTAYYAYQIGEGTMIATEMGGQVVITDAVSGALVGSAASGSEVAAGALAAQGAADAGATGAAAVSSGLEGFTSALLNPTTIVIALVVMAVMKVLFGKGCDQTDSEAALFSASGYCHDLGTICDKKIKLIGCVQRSRRFCCFNSKMARIVAEQGRPQLKAFGPNGGWGTPENPNCRGFTPEEFQQLDFSKINMSEYFNDIMAGMNQNIQDARGKIRQGIQNHYQATQ